MSVEDTIRALREALAVSPDNVPLRKHLAQSLMGMARFAEAESEFREALRRAPADEELKLGLARAFASNGKRSEALVILEEMIRSSKHPSAAYVLQARLLHGWGETARAVREYKKAIEADPDAADGELAEALGIGADEDSVSDVVDGRLRASAGDEESAVRDLRIERPDLGFSRIGGLEAVKEEIRMKIINPAPASGPLQGLRQDAGRRHPALRPARLRQDAPRPRDGGRDQGRLPRRRHPRRARHVDRRERAEPPPRLRAGAAHRAPACCSSTRSTRSARAAPTCVAASGRHVINQFLSELDGADDGQRRPAGPRRDQRAVASRLGVPAPGPVRPHHLRAAAGPGRAPGDPRGPHGGAARRRKSTSRRSRRRPTGFPAPI